MHHRWLGKLHSRPWAPRTLAVLSCALALLAAQPASAASPPSSSRQFPLVSPTLCSSATPLFQLREAASTPALPAATRRETTFFSSARRLHILATVEILKRLLISELQPTSHPIIPALILEPLEVIQPLALAPICRRSSAPPPYAPLPPPERRFLLQHLQLAPPIV